MHCAINIAKTKINELKENLKDLIDENIRLKDNLLNN